jgi:aminoacylase
MFTEFRVTAKGKTGHASIMFEDTAAEKLHHVINKLLGIRSEQKKLWHSSPDIDLGDVTSVNMTMLGVSTNANEILMTLFSNLCSNCYAVSYEIPT